MIVVVRLYWQDSTSPKINLMGGFFKFNIEMKWVFLAKSIDRRARGGRFVPGSTRAGNWSRYNCVTLWQGLAKLSLYQRIPTFILNAA